MAKSLFPCFLASLPLCLPALSVSEGRVSLAIARCSFFRQFATEYPCQRRAYGDHAEVRRRKLRQHPAELPNRRPRRTHDVNCLCHVLVCSMLPRQFLSGSRRYSPDKHLPRERQHDIISLTKRCDLAFGAHWSFDVLNISTGLSSDNFDQTNTKHGFRTTSGKSVYGRLSELPLQPTKAGPFISYFCLRTRCYGRILKKVAPPRLPKSGRPK